MCWLVAGEMIFNDNSDSGTFECCYNTCFIREMAILGGNRIFGKDTTNFTHIRIFRGERSYVHFVCAISILNSYPHAPPQQLAVKCQPILSKSPAMILTMIKVKAKSRRLCMALSIETNVDQQMHQQHVWSSMLVEISVSRATRTNANIIAAATNEAINTPLQVQDYSAGNCYVKGGNELGTS